MLAGAEEQNVDGLCDCNYWGRMVPLCWEQVDVDWRGEYRQVGVTS